MTIAELIMKARTDKGMGRRPGSDALGCSPSALEAWERGFRVPALEWTNSLAAFTGQPVEKIKEMLLREHGYLGPDEHLVVSSGTGPKTRQKGAPKTVKSGLRTVSVGTNQLPTMNAAA